VCPRRVVIAIAGFVTRLAAQTLMNGAEIPAIAPYFVPVTGEKQLSCTVFPHTPILNYSFRFSSGYNAELPLTEWASPDRRVLILSRVNPAVGNAAYFMDTLKVPDGSNLGAVFSFDGAFQVGAGTYRVDWMMFDRAGRVCRRDWIVNAHLAPPNVGLTLDIPPNSVSGSGPYPTVADVPLPGKRLHRTTLLLDASPSDGEWLVRCVGSLMKRLPADTMRVIVLSLEAQKEIFRVEGAQPGSLPEISRAIDGISIPQPIVDFRTLENLPRPIDLIVSMIRQEIRCSSPADAVILMGPGSRHRGRAPLLQGRVPRIVSRRDFRRAPRFYYLEFGDRLDSVRSTMRRVRGKTFEVQSPADLVQAIGRIRKDFDRP
jgi:hypothetical protein